MNFKEFGVGYFFRGWRERVFHWGIIAKFIKRSVGVLTFVFYFSGSFLETAWSLEGAESMEDSFMSSVRYFITAIGRAFLEVRASSKVCENKTSLGV